MDDSYSSLGDFLRKEVTDWEDENVTTGRYRAFTGQRQDWEGRLLFWKDLIEKVARHLDVVVIDSQTVQQKWFARDGINPMGLKQVLVEMIKSGDLEPLNQMLGSRPSNVELLSSVINKAVLWAACHVLGKNMDPELALDNQLVVRVVLEERVLNLINMLVDSHHSSSCVITLARLQELCRGADDAKIIIAYLSMCGRARYITVDRTDYIEGFKISLNNCCCDLVSEVDENLLQLYWTAEMLQLRSDRLGNQITVTQSFLVKAVNARQKQEALRHLKSVKMLKSTQEQCMVFMDKIEGILGFIADSETTKKVLEAVKVGNSVMKDHHVPLEDVKSCLDDLYECHILHKQTEEALGEASIGAVEFDNEALDEELALLELEENSMVVDVKERITEQQHNPVTVVDENLRKNSHQTEFEERISSKLTLELA